MIHYELGGQALCNSYKAGLLIDPDPHKVTCGHCKKALEDYKAHSGSWLLRDQIKRFGADLAEMNKKVDKLYYLAAYMAD